MTEVIASREISIIDGGSIFIEIEKPIEIDGIWKCYYNFAFSAERKKTYSMNGVDSMQSILHAIKGIQLYLESTKEFKMGRLRWLDDHDMGFNFNFLNE